MMWGPTDVNINNQAMKVNIDTQYIISTECTYTKWTLIIRNVNNTTEYLEFHESLPQLLIGLH